MEDNSSGSSAVTGIPPASFLQRMMERLSSTNSLKLNPGEAAPVAVISLQRYLSERTEAQQQQQQQSDIYNYDLTVTDGVWRAKCFLHSGLNRLVHKGILRTGTDISITQCSFVYDERRLGHGYICIESLRCDVEGSAALSRRNDVSSLPLLLKHGMESSVLLQSDAPLQVSRKHYLSLWNNDDPEGDIWSSEPPVPNPMLDVSRVMHLSSLESGFRDTCRSFSLLVKIIHKSRLRYYGKVGLNIDYPYQAYFEVADQSGTMSLVLWNELCPEFYQRLNVGTVLYLQNYTLKQSYSNRSRPQMDHHRLKIFTSVEICLNPRNPTAVITVVSPKNVQPEWMLPDVSYLFTTRLEMDKLANNTACDVIGLVTFVGRVERVKRKANKGPEKYWTYRWVHAVDGTSHHPFILELFSSSQAEVFSRICPMTYLVCTQMRVCHVEGSLPYLTSSCETEMFITGCHRGRPYVSDPTVKSFIQWTKTQKDHVVLQKTAVGGHYCYPRPPRIFTQSMADSSVPLVAVVDLKRELASLQYRERKKVAIQGQITAVRYMERLQTTDAPRTGEVSTDACEQAAPDPHNHQAGASTCSPSPSPSLCPSPSSSSPSGSRSAKRQKQEILIRKAAQSALKNKGTSAKRRLIYEDVEKEGNTPEDEDSDSTCESQRVQHSLQTENADPKVSSWESGSWAARRQEACEHLCAGGLHLDSVSRQFTFEDKEALLQWANLQPTRWTPRCHSDTLPPATCPGYYQVTILGINKQFAVDAAYVAVASSEEPRARGLPQDPHGNTMLSCLSSGFFCPLVDADGLSQSALPEPERILATACELEDAHVVCILDLCHLGGDKVEILINKVYRVEEISLD